MVFRFMVLVGCWFTINQALDSYFHRLTADNSSM